MRSALRPKALVSAWFDFLGPGHRTVAEALQAAVHRAVPEASETIKWGNLVFGVDDVLVMAIVPHKAHINLQFFNGSELPAELGPLDGVGRGSRSLRCKLNQPVDAVQVEMLAAASAALARQNGRRSPRQGGGGCS